MIVDIFAYRRSRYTTGGVNENRTYHFFSHIGRGTGDYVVAVCSSWKANLNCRKTFLKFNPKFKIAPPQKGGFATPESQKIEKKFFLIFLNFLTQMPFLMSLPQVNHISCGLNRDYCFNLTIFREGTLFHVFRQSVLPRWL